MLDGTLGQFSIARSSMQSLDPPADLGLQVGRSPSQFRKLRIILLNSVVVRAFETPGVQSIDLNGYITIRSDLFGN